MLKKGRGSIINMASVASSIRGLPNRFVYGASKAAVIGLTKSIAADYVGKESAATRFARARWTPSLQGRINAFADPVQAQGLRRPAADGPPRHRGRHHRHPRVPRLRRVAVRNRERLFDGGMTI